MAQLSDFFVLMAMPCPRSDLKRVADSGSLRRLSYHPADQADVAALALHSRDIEGRHY
jgi:hypothetical protein